LASTGGAARTRHPAASTAQETGLRMAHKKPLRCWRGFLPVAAQPPRGFAVRSKASGAVTLRPALALPPLRSFRRDPAYALTVGGSGLPFSTEPAFQLSTQAYHILEHLVKEDARCRIHDAGSSRCVLRPASPSRGSG
jgi:hypothetical protein